MAVDPIPEPMSVETYLRLERQSEVRHEFVDGYRMLMARGSRNHCRMEASIIRALGQRLLDGPRSVLTSDAQVRIGSRYFYGDASVSCDERDAREGDDICFPYVIFEVLSPTSEAYDRGDKFDMYQECSTLQEYVLVNIQRPEIQVFRRCDGAWTLRTSRSGDKIELASLRIQVSVDEIYAGIEFPPTVT